MGRSELVDIVAEVIHETELAYLLAPDGEKERKKWAPKSAVERDNLTFTMPRAMAEDKGFV